MKPIEVIPPPPPFKFFPHQPIMRTADGIAEEVIYRMRHPYTLKILNEKRRRRA